MIDSGQGISKIVINRAVRQGCNLSPTLFSIYLDDVGRKWKKKVNNEIKIKLRVLLYSVSIKHATNIFESSQNFIIFQDKSWNYTKSNFLCLFGCY